MPPKLAAALFAAMWTRYEAWPIVGAALAAAGYATWRRGAALDTLVRAGDELAIWPALAVVIFLINSRITVGAWFVSDGFYVPDPTYAHQPLRTLVGIWWGTHQLSGYVIETVALVAAVAIAWRALRRARQDASLLDHAGALRRGGAAVRRVLSTGIPYRIRYMIPVVAACAVFCGLAVGFDLDTVRSGRLP